MLGDKDLFIMDLVCGACHRVWVVGLSHTQVLVHQVSMRFYLSSKSKLSAHKIHSSNIRWQSVKYNMWSKLYNNDNWKLEKCGHFCNHQF